MLKKILVWTLALWLCNAALAQTKQRIDKASDLPRFTYPVAGSLEQLVRDENAFNAFAVKLRTDVESVLSTYDIADKSMQRQLLGTLLQLDTLEGKDAAALARIEEIRALQDKPADKLLTGVQARAIIESRQAAGTAASEAYRQDVGRRIGEALKAMPYAVITNGIREAKASAELIGEALVLGNVRDVLQPVVDKAGALSSDLAPGVVNARFALALRLPLKQTLIGTYGTYLAANQINKPDIWSARNVKLAAGRPYTPVTVAVWDSGVDSALFGKQVLRNATAKPLLIAFDKYSSPASTELEPIPPELQAKLPTMKARTKGFSDLQSNVDSPEATEVKQLLSNLKPDEFKVTIEEINLAGNYEHGTHVAGIALDGNPYARLLIARIEFGHTLMPDPCPSRAQAQKDASAITRSIEFLKRHRARVVNMSWGGNVRSIEKDLEQCGVGKTPDERKVLAREYFDLFRNALRRGFASAPEILWITAAGNSNQDATFAEDAPADIALPNLLTVGAVDQAGDEASFTSYGPTVKVHANGYQVESVLPGGDRVALSGTSMASPQVANLAGKILAVNPKLTPPQVIAIIVATANKTPDGRRTLVNPAKALDAARPSHARQP
ncbi:S8 family serine peptidase [Piscinibacter sp.]|uniref:S8 family serine peptidase n=1 Tax=Piscinibacter sp. TaxID=1903157 RepID=UPI002F423A68